MSKELLYFFQDDVDSRFIGNLDLELLVCGHADQKTDLENFHPFRIDPFFRIYHPKHGSVSVMDSNGVTRIMPGKCYIFPAEVPFRMISEGGFTHDWLHFKSALLERQPGFRRILSVPVTSEMEALWREFLIASKSEKNFKNIFRAHQVLRQILLPFLMLPETSRRKTAENSERFDEVLQYIGKHYMDSLQTPELAKMVHMNRNNFSMAFRKEFGVSPKEHLTNTRIANAKKLLLTTSLTIKEIALQCGFHDDLFFYRIFKKHIGMTPIHYRETMYLGK